jgi:D-alanine transaminase
MSRIVYVNGEFTEEGEAKISIFDRGFIFGDGVYEVVPVINNQLVDKEYFLDRLERSLNEIQIAWPCPKEEYVKILEKLVIKNRLTEGIVYTQVTRGVADRNFPFPIGVKPSFVAFTSVMELLNNPDAAEGINVITTPDLRWKRRDIKSLNLLGQILAKQDAVSKGATEGWMVEDGYVTEGVSSSAYIVKNGKVITRPLSNEILPGIRRRIILEIATVTGIEYEERLFTVAEALEADEAFISSATTIALAVVNIDGQVIGTGKPGPITCQLRDLYKIKVIEEASINSD